MTKEEGEFVRKLVQKISYALDVASEQFKNMGESEQEQQMNEAAKALMQLWHLIPEGVEP